MRRLTVRVQVMARGRATGQPILRHSALQRKPPQEAAPQACTPQEAAPQARKLQREAVPQARRFQGEAEPQARRPSGPTLLKQRGDVKAVRHSRKAMMTDEKETKTGPAQSGPRVRLIRARRADSDSKGPLAPSINAPQVKPELQHLREKRERGRLCKPTMILTSSCGVRR